MVGNRQRYPRTAAIVEGDEARRDRRVVEAREAAGIERRGRLLRDARRVIDAVEAVEPVRRQDREDALAAAAAERSASRHDGGGAALVAAVATERSVIDRLWRRARRQPWGQCRQLLEQPDARRVVPVRRQVLDQAEQPDGHARGGRGGRRGPRPTAARALSGRSRPRSRPCRPSPRFETAGAAPLAAGDRPRR